MKVNAYIINRNLLSTLKGTVEFLKKDPRIDIWILDNDSTYGPLLEYYKTNPCKIHYFKRNAGAYCYWEAFPFKENEYYIITDSDCIYDNIPENWLDVMLEKLKTSKYDKVGFSLEIKDIPESKMKQVILDYEEKWWVVMCEGGYIAQIDTTFALYKPNSKFSYEAIRLDRPYTIKHYPWYIPKDDIPHEWEYYLDNINNQSFWGNQIKKATS